MTPAPTPLVSVIIPHYLGDVLLRCLASAFARTPGLPFEVIVADDQPRDDGSIRQAMERWPEVRVVRVGGGRGLGAAVNAGIRAARAPLLFVLNKDAQVGEDWIPPLLDAAARHPESGAFQLKVRSLKDPARFDYGGGAGGLIDRLGHPIRARRPRARSCPTLAPMVWPWLRMNGGQASSAGRPVFGGSARTPRGASRSRTGGCQGSCRLSWVVSATVDTRGAACADEWV